MSKKLLTKLTSILALGAVLSTAPILSACNSDKETNNSMEESINNYDNEFVTSINSNIKQDTEMDLQINGVAVQRYNYVNFVHIYASEYYPPLYSYEFSANSVKAIKIQDEFYKHYTISYCLENLKDKDIPFALDTVYRVENFNDNQFAFIVNATEDLEPSTIIEDGAVEGDLTYGG